MMKPAYEEKLKRAASKGIPQSPIHGAASKSTSLRRSATVSGEVSAMSPRVHRSKTLRDRTLPIMHNSGTLTFRRARGNSEGIINPGDIPRGSTRTDRNKHHYGPALDPSLLKKLSHKLNKFASGASGNDHQHRHEPLPDVVGTTRFAINSDSLGTAFNNNIDPVREEPSPAGSFNKLDPNTSTNNSNHEVETFECMTNGHASTRSNNGSSSGHHDHNANPQQVEQ